MKIHYDGKVLVTHCEGCMCHDIAMQFGDLREGCCTNCSCPKTAEAWEREYAKKSKRKGVNIAEAKT